MSDPSVEATRALWEGTDDNLIRGRCAELLTVAELGPEALTAAYAHPKARAIANAWWVGEVAVRTVRSAASDDPVVPDGPKDLAIPRVCAGCGGKATTIIAFVYGFLPGDYLSFELRCGDCGRYTLYTLED